MITEDYVSFEIAKLLKEKGFDENTPVNYFVGDDKPHGCMVGEMIYHKRLEEDTHLIACPTLQMAMKWLRNKHDIVCSVGLFTDLPETPPYWSFNILNQSTAKVMYEAFDIKCETYEQACESAIKYCLEILI